MKYRTVVVVGAMAVAVLVAGLTSGQEAEVARQSKYRIWYTSPDARVELGHHWASRHLGDEWLILKVSIAGGAAGVIEVERSAVRVQSPAGEVYQLPTQSEFREGLGEYRMALQRDNTWEPASSAFERSLTRADEWFFSPPGSYFHRDTIYPSNFQYCTGPMVFRVPGGVQPGEWTLMIDLEESKVRVPFVLEAKG